MDKFYFPDDYESPQSIIDTQKAIKDVKDYFQVALANALDLTRISAPIFVTSESGLNDNLNGVEDPVSFNIKEQDNREVEIVHSLAKWKRVALYRYGFKRRQGLYADMTAIRKDECTDNIHSLYVDQWDWEIMIDKSERNIEMLKEVVFRIFMVIKQTEYYVCGKYHFMNPFLPNEIYFVTTQELEDRWPDKTPKEREDMIAREKGAVFLMKIGGDLRRGKPHGSRAPDYDDWELNGDIIVYYPILDIALELSSMGIRVDGEALTRQLKLAGCEERANLPFHKLILENKLPYSIGGGIGQSRICMFFLQRAHIGEVQSSVWPDEVYKAANAHNVNII